MGLPKVVRDENCLYLIQDISGYGTYDKAKAIVDFCDKETKKFEKEIDMLIMDIFKRNGINIPNTTKSVLKRAFDMLKAKCKSIAIVDLFKNVKGNEDSEVIKYTKNRFTIYLECEYICGCYVETLQTGIELREIKL